MRYGVFYLHINIYVKFNVKKAFSTRSTFLFRLYCIPNIVLIRFEFRRLIRCGWLMLFFFSMVSNSIYQFVCIPFGSTTPQFMHIKCIRCKLEWKADEKNKRKNRCDCAKSCEIVLMSMSSYFHHLMFLLQFMYMYDEIKKNHLFYCVFDV